MPYEVIDHTADVGLRVQAATIESALADLVEGFGWLVCPEGEVQQASARTLELTSPTIEDLVVDLLDEANFLVQIDGFLPAAATIELETSGEGVHATVELRGDTYDREQHGHLMEIKATTYHELEVNRDPARIAVIFDV